MMKEEVNKESEKSKYSSEMEMLYAESLRDLKEGDVVKGRIVDITSRDILIDVGYKSEGVIPRSEFPDAASMKVGDEVEVLLESKEDENGMVVLSKWKADRKQGWDKIIKSYEEGDLIEGRITKKVKGGLMTDVGMEAFLPASQVSLKPFANLDQFVGQTFKFKIIKINKNRKNIVISRRAVLQIEREEAKATLFKDLAKGQVKKGVVKNITDFGAFLDLGGVDGLLHITDMSWGRVSHPSEIVALGDEIEVVILGFDEANVKISLGLKQLTPSPWQDVEAKYPVGERVKGKVVNIMPYGAFVELEKGLEGLVHISELSWTRKVTTPNEVLAIGDIVEAVVLSIDSQSKKISLGIRQTEANPWLEVETKYPPGTKIKGKVRNLTDYGAFVELEGGIDGLIHVSDMSWTKRIGHPQEMLKKGKTVEAVVLSVDSGERKISLGMKQLTPDPWPEIIERYTVGSLMDGRITKVADFGLFVELEEDIEGLVHISEINITPSQRLEETFKVGDEVKVKVIKVNGEQRKIGLSMEEI